MSRGDTGRIDEEERLVALAEGEGRISVVLYRNGAFSEPDFVTYGVLERLVIDKRLRFLGRSGDQFNAAYHYGPLTAGGARRAAA